MERKALSARAAGREYGIDRRAIAAAIHSGDLTAAQIGCRRFLILRHHLEAWIAKYRIEGQPERRHAP